MDIAILYSSPFGSTAEIADTIAAVIEKEGHTALVDSVTSPQAARYLADADAIVLGSGVYLGEWTQDMQRFVGEHHQAIAQRPLAIYSVGFTGETPEVPEELEPVLSTVLLGRLQEGMEWSDHDSRQAHDRRDWHEIRGYAAQLSQALTS